MDRVYRLDPMVSSSEDVVSVDNVSSSSLSELHRGPVVNNSDRLEPAQVTGSDMPHQLIKTQIANHPLYPNLLSAYIECQKVGAPPELASLLEEISRENHPMTAPRQIGDDPELDRFMESYCEVLHRYKEELSRPFNEATLFLGNIESQLSNLCKGTLTNSSDYRSDNLVYNLNINWNRYDEARISPVSLDEAGVSSGEEYSFGEVEAGEGPGSSGSTCQGDKEIREMLLRKYSGYLGNLRKEFLKRTKKGKLPKDARMALLNWWNTHYRWPYPTEEEKLKLSEMSGLNQKQINNWFINQRKRHWKPSEDMSFGIMKGVSGGAFGIGGPIFFESGAPPQPHHR